MPSRLDPAPQRGRYDRTLHSDARRARQHERLLVATTHALAEHGLQVNVAHIVRAARVGRNTFYEHFDQLDAAIEAATARGVAMLRERLARSTVAAWTPREQLRGALREWVAFAGDQPFVARALLRARSRASRSVLTCAGEPLRDVLRQLLAAALRDAVISIAPDEPRLIAVTAAVEAIGRWRLEHPWSRTDDASTAVDLVLRAFR